MGTRQAAPLLLAAGGVLAVSLAGCDDRSAGGSPAPVIPVPDPIASPPPPPEPPPLPPVTIRGFVRDAGRRDVDGRRFATTGASVTVLDGVSGEAVGTALADREGAWAFPDLDGDRFEVVATAPGFVPVRRDVENDGSGTVIVAFMMSEPSGEFLKPFWDELVFGAFECHPDKPDFWPAWCLNPQLPLALRSSRVLGTRHPDFYVRTVVEERRTRRPLEPVDVPALFRIRDEIPRVMEAITGEPFRGRIRLGEEAHAAGSWVYVRFLREEGARYVGLGTVGFRYGDVWLNLASIRRDYEAMLGVLRHEIGHVMGFSHVHYATSVMCPACPHDEVSVSDRLHMRRAFREGQGLRYVDGPQLPAPPRGGPDSDRVPVFSPVPRSWFCPAPAVEDP